MLLREDRYLYMDECQALEWGDVLVRGNRIAALGPQGMVAVPPGTAVRDVTGSTILPGYVATHEHIEAPYNVHAPRVWQYLLTLAYGVTAILDPQAESSADKLA